VGLRQGQKYVAKVFERWAEDQREFGHHRGNQMRAAAQNLYRECWEQGRLSTCVRVLTLLCKIDGLFDQKLEVHHHHRRGFNPDGSRDIRYMTSHEKRMELDRLLTKAFQNSPRLRYAPHQ
jgi:hypothetical protein